MATTFDQLISRVRQQLMGYTQGQASVSELATAMGPTDTSFTVDVGTVTNLSRGLVEIDDEMILVKAYDRTSGVVTVMGRANGRGREGTVAASHAQYALVTSSPAFPRVRIKEAINDTITGLYPQLVVFGTTEFTRVSVVYGYGMPADAADVWFVHGKQIGPTRTWPTLRNWEFNPKASISDFPTGKTIEIYDIDKIAPGQTIRVVYAKRLAPLVNGSDDFTTVTGYDDRITDLVAYGALKRLLPAYEAARLQQQAVEATERAGLVPTQSAAKAVQLYASLYSERLEQERNLMFTEVANLQTYNGV